MWHKQHHTGLTLFLSYFLPIIVSQSAALTAHAHAPQLQCCQQGAFLAASWQSQPQWKRNWGFTQAKVNMMTSGAEERDEYNSTGFPTVCGVKKPCDSSGLWSKVFQGLDSPMEIHPGLLNPNMLFTGMTTCKALTHPRVSAQIRFMGHCLDSWGLRSLPTSPPALTHLQVENHGKPCYNPCYNPWGAVSHSCHGQGEIGFPMEIIAHIHFNQLFSNIVLFILEYSWLMSIPVSCHCLK